MEKKFKVKWEYTRIHIEYYDKDISICVDDENDISLIKKLIKEKINTLLLPPDSEAFLDLTRESITREPINFISIEPYNVLSIKPKPSLNIYHLFRDNTEFDEVESFVIVAENDTEARKIAAENKGDESKDVWLVPSYSVLHTLGKYNSPYKDEPHVVNKNVLNG